MRITFNSMTITNFKSFSGSHTLDLSFYENGLHFLRGKNKDELDLGSNGSGKSTIWDALSWGLFGRTPGGLRNPDIKPWKGAKKTSVVIDLTIDEERHELFRGVGPNKLQIDGDDCGQEQVDRLIGFGFDVFTHTILLGQGRPLFFDLTARSKMDLFVDVLNLQRWDYRAQIASEKVSELSVVVSSLENKLSVITASKSQLIELLKSTRSKSSNWQLSRNDRIQKAHKDLKKAELDLKNAMDNITDAEISYDNAEVEMRSLDKQLQALRIKHNSVREKYDRADLQIEMWEKELDKLNRKLRNFNRQSICPTCGQSIKNDDVGVHKTEMQTEVKALKAKIKKGIAPALEKRIALVEKKVKIEENHYSEFKQKASDARLQTDYWSPKRADAKALAKQLTNTIEQFENEDNPYTKQISELRRKKTQWVKEEREISIDLKRKYKRIERTKFWIKGFKDVRLHVINQVIEELQLTTNAILADVGLRDWQVLYDVERETKSGTIQRGLIVTVLSPNNSNPVRWESWSGGEGQRLRVVGALALSEVLLNYANVIPDLEVLDEPTQHLSPEGVHDLCTFLAMRAKQIGRKIIYVDHQSVESMHFASVTTVVKTSKGSRIQVRR